MKMLRGFLCLFLLVALSNVCLALTPDTVLVSTDKPWVIAGGTDVSTVTVQVSNITTSAPVIGALVTVTVTDPLMGIVSPMSQTIGNTNQSVSFTFRAGTKSGNATLSVSVFNEGVTKTASAIQRVDHAIPAMYSEIIYPANATVNTTVKILIKLKDTYNNIIDGKNTGNRFAENIVFLASPDSGGFWDGGTPLGYRTEKYTNETGYASIDYRVSTIAALNTLQVIANSCVYNNYQWITIQSIAATPVTITSSIISTSDIITAEPHTALANGIDKFSIYYTVYDNFGNPVPGSIVQWSSSEGMSAVYTTNYQGVIFLQYGPSDALKDLSINAKTGDITRTDLVRFISDEPVFFELSANPSIIASLEANPDSKATVYVRLLDAMGLPVTGKQVQFDIKDMGNSSLLLQNPSLSNTSAVSDVYGYANIYVYPGRFPVRNATGYKENSTGYIVISASWGAINKEVRVDYKNYPFLRVQTRVEPETVNVTEPVDITIQLIGDGYAPYKPIDIVLATHRGESILGDMQEGGTGLTRDRMLLLRDAAITVSHQLRNSTDRMGSVTFGTNGTTYLPTKASQWQQVQPGPDNGKDLDVEEAISHYYSPSKNYSDYATLDNGLTFNHDEINANIMGMIPSKESSGGLGKYTVSTRYGLYKAIKELTLGGNSTWYSKQSVKAVILFTDIQWTNYGDPSAGWDGVNVNNQGTYADQINLTYNWPQSGVGPWAAFHDLGALNDPSQNLANYAIENKVRVYAIAFYPKNANIDKERENILRTISEPTGGKFYFADNGTSIKQIYQSILEELHIFASVGTSLDVSMSDVRITHDNATNFTSGKDLFNYLPIENHSTNISSWNTTGMIKDPLRTELGSCGGNYPANAIPLIDNCNTTYPYNIDQTVEWENNGLTFYVGNVSIKQTWQAVFTLLPKKPGNIDLFGNKSNICYTNEDLADKICLPLPYTPVNVMNNTIPGPTKQMVLDIIDGSLKADPEGSTELLNVTWRLNYTGNETVKQLVYYQFSQDREYWTNDWIQYDTSLTIKRNVTPDELFQSNFNARDREGWVKFKVFAFEEPYGGISDIEITSEPIDIGAVRGNTIKIS